MHKELHKNYYNKINYLVQTGSWARYSGIKLPEAHGMGKNLDPNIKPEKQHANPIKGSVVKPHIGQGRAGLKGKRSDPINQTINPTMELSQKIPGETKIETGKTNQIHSKDPMHSVNNADEGMIHTRPLIPDVPFHPGPTYRPPPKPIWSNMPRSQEGSPSSSSTENINPDCYIIFFYQLTAISVIALLNTIVEAVSDNRELTRVFHQIISSDFKVIAPASFYCIRSSRYFYSLWICWYLLLSKETCSLI